MAHPALHRSMKSELAPLARSPLERCADSASLAEAAEILARGGLVAFPTETVYGLGADATSDAAVARIFAAKGRPEINPLIAHVASLDSARTQGEFSREASRLAEVFWPGPLTLVVPAAPGIGICPRARAGRDTIALRIPSHPVALALVTAAGRPIAAPSANRSGRVSPVTAEHVVEDLDGAVDLVLDGGRCPLGLESTIVACLDGPPRLLRSGALSRAALEAVLGFPLAEAAPHKDILAPGMLASHYAPCALLRLGAAELRDGEAGLDFGKTFPAGDNVLDLSPDRDLDQAAANFFLYLRKLDSLGCETIAVAPIPSEGAGVAINDRLFRAAAPRPASARGPKDRARGSEAR
jgi:L-threonylcarbamoyladenylate synthase